jgi:hypothetical protein
LGDAVSIFTKAKYNLPLMRWFLHAQCSIEEQRKESYIEVGLYWDRSEFESQYGQEFFLLYVLQTCSGVYPTTYTMGGGGSFTGIKAAGP